MPPPVPTRLVVALALAATGGCSFDRAGVGRGDDRPADAGDAADAEVVAIDSGVPADAFTCDPWNAANVDPCDGALGVPSPLILGSGRYRYDTDTGVLTSPGNQMSTPAGGLLGQTGGPEVRVLAVTVLTVPVGSTLAAIGSHPLVIIVHGDAVVDGAIDVSARVDVTGLSSTPGPGGNDATFCAAGTGDPGVSATVATIGGGGGGGGGGYGGDGGNGGNGQGSGNGNGGAKGTSAGAATAFLCANGGGGGEGGQSGLLPSEPGEPAACSETPRAAGGGIQVDAGDGGDGGILGNLNATNATNGANNAGGGGGGASAGRIRVRGRTTRNLDLSSTVSPDPAI